MISLHAINHDKYTYITPPIAILHTEVGKVTLKSNGDEAVSNESLKRSKGVEALNDDFS
jgi:hypothetical protein